MADRFQIKADGRDRLEILPILSILLPHIWINILFIARSAHVTQSHKKHEMQKRFLNLLNCVIHISVNQLWWIVS